MIDIDFSAFEALESEFDRARAALAGDMIHAVRGAADAGAAQARLDAPRRSGALADSISSDVTSVSGSEAEGQIHVAATYASHVVDGTDPHVIRPKTARVLAFESNGERVFARKVNHPGTAPNNFLDRAKQLAEGELEHLANQAANDFAARLSG